MEPRLIVADEPLSGADVSIRGQILNLLSDIQKERGLAYLMITHDISIARAFADRVAVMSEGRIVEQGQASRRADEAKGRLYQASPRGGAKYGVCIFQGNYLEIVRFSISSKPI